MTTKKGREFEDKAVQALTSIGLSIVDRNIRTPFGEIDIIALDGETLCVIEVKGRTASSDWDVDRIPVSKQRRISKSIEYIMMDNSDLPEFDDIELCAFYWNNGQPLFLRDAFDGQ